MRPKPSINASQQYRGCPRQTTVTHSLTLSLLPHLPEPWRQNHCNNTIATLHASSLRQQLHVITSPHYSSTRTSPKATCLARLLPKADLLPTRHVAAPDATSRQSRMVRNHVVRPEDLDVVRQLDWCHWYTIRSFCMAGLQ
jgi:hypothetical protein